MARAHKLGDQTDTPRARTLKALGLKTQKALSGPFSKADDGPRTRDLRLGKAFRRFGGLGRVGENRTRKRFSALRLLREFGRFRVACLALCSHFSGSRRQAMPWPQARLHGLPGCTPTENRRSATTHRSLMPRRHGDRPRLRRELVMVSDIFRLLAF
jgi:hypothetical protein